jgi:Tfp pilus assembly pilus retraction ATPase PilT
MNDIKVEDNIMQDMIKMREASNILRDKIRYDLLLQFALTQDPDIIFLLERL